MSTIYTIATIVVGFLALFYIIQRLLKALKNKQKPDFASTEELMEHFTQQALTVAKKGFGKKLDFSVNSLEEVEEILGKLHEEYIKTKNDKGMYGNALFFGAYIGTVIKKETSQGRWEKEHPDLGDDVFPFYMDDEGCVFPVSWCYKRIIDGEGDDIVFKYQSLVINKFCKYKTERPNITNSE